LPVDQTAKTSKVSYHSTVALKAIKLKIANLDDTVSATVNNEGVLTSLGPPTRLDRFTRDIQPTVETDRQGFRADEEINRAFSTISRSTTEKSSAVA